MNEAVSSVVRTQSSNSAAAKKVESETVKSAQEVFGGQNTALETVVSSRYDTVELSREYLEYKTHSENSTLQDETNQLNSTVIKYLGKSEIKRPVLNNQLYACDEIELLSLYNDGAISREEFQDEIESRN